MKKIETWCTEININNTDINRESQLLPQDQCSNYTFTFFFSFLRGYVAVFATLISRGFITVSRFQLAHLKKALNLPFKPEFLLASPHEKKSERGGGGYRKAETTATVA